MTVPMPVKLSHWMLIGGKMAAVEDVVQFDDEWEFLIVPTDWMRYKYQIEDSQMKDNRIRIRLKRKYCINVDPSPYCSTWLILCDLNGREDRGLINLVNSQLLDENTALRNENKTLRGLLLRQHFDMQNIMEFPSAFKDKLLKEVEMTRKAINLPQQENVQQQP